MNQRKEYTEKYQVLFNKEQQKIVDTLRSQGINVQVFFRKYVEEHLSKLLQNQ